MIKEKSFHSMLVIAATTPRGNAKLPMQTNYDCSAINRFIEAIGPERVVSVAGLGNVASGDYTVFYRADDLLSCPDCQWDYSPDHTFCGHCGKSLVPISDSGSRACVHCGQPLLPITSTFCSFCGQHQYGPSKKKMFLD